MADNKRIQVLPIPCFHVDEEIFGVKWCRRFPGGNVNQTDLNEGIPAYEQILIRIRRRRARAVKKKLLQACSPGKTAASAHSPKNRRAWSGEVPGYRHRREWMRLL